MACADLLVIYAGLAVRSRAQLGHLRSAALRALLGAPKPPATAAARAIYALAQAGSGDDAAAAALARGLGNGVERLSPQDAAGAMWAAATRPNSVKGIDMLPVLRQVVVAPWKACTSDISTAFWAAAKLQQWQRRRGGSG